MRIAIFSLAYHPIVGGAEIAVKEITDRIPSADFFCFTHRFEATLKERERVGRVNVARVGKGGGGGWQKFLYIFRAWRAAEKMHKERPLDAIWAIMAAYAGCAALLFKLRHPSMPFLLTLQEGDSEWHILKRVGIFYPLWRLIFKKADYIQAISNYLADFGRRHGAKCPIEIVPNGTEIRIKNHELRIKNNDRKIIITTSRLVYKNGIDILIRAIGLLKAKSYKLKALILGMGPDEKQLKDLAKKLGVENYVEFLGHIEPDKIPEYLASADIFVRMSRSEGLGNSFLEAMAAGLPVIGTDVGGIKDFLIDGENGLLAKVNDPVDCAQKLKRLMDDSALRQRLSENGRKLVEEKYIWDSIAIKMERLFNKLISNS